MCLRSATQWKIRCNLYIWIVISKVHLIKRHLRLSNVSTSVKYCTRTNLPSKRKRNDNRAETTTTRLRSLHPQSTSGYILFKALHTDVVVMMPIDPWGIVSLMNEIDQRHVARHKYRHWQLDGVKRTAVGRWEHSAVRHEKSGFSKRLMSHGPGSVCADDIHGVRKQHCSSFAKAIDSCLYGIRPFELVGQNGKLRSESSNAYHLTTRLSPLWGSDLRRLSARHFDGELAMWGRENHVPSRKPKPRQGLDDCRRARRRAIDLAKLAGTDGAVLGRV